MKTIALYVLLMSALLARSAFASGCPVTLNHEVKRLNEDRTVSLCDEYQGKVVLVVNTASKCAFTPQYEGLEDLYARYRDRGLVVLGFPSNDFANQEPGDEARIQEFCRLTYGVKFPMFGKTRVRKNFADPLYRTLGELAGEYPQWNFHKYLLNRDGELIGSYGPHIQPADRRLMERIEQSL